LYLLSNFSSVFELSAALSLAYGLIKTAYRYPLDKLEKLLDNSKKAHADYGHEDPSNSLGSAIKLFENQYFVLSLDVDKFYLIAARCSLFSAALPISILIWAGFSDEKFALSLVVTLITSCLITAPLLALISWARSQMFVKEMQGVINILRKETLDLISESQARYVNEKHRNKSK
jgi:hypothetical protein